MKRTRVICSTSASHEARVYSANSNVILYAIARPLAIGGRSHAQPVCAGRQRRDGGQIHDRLGGHHSRAGGHRRDGDRPHVGWNGSGVYEERQHDSTAFATKDLFQQDICMTAVTLCVLDDLEKLKSRTRRISVGVRL